MMNFIVPNFNLMTSRGAFLKVVKPPRPNEKSEG